MKTPTRPPASAGLPAGSVNRLHRPHLWLGTLVAGYIGVYLCRKNLSVAVPMLQADFGINRADIGKVASYSTIAYAVGKFIFGPVVDKLGGRAGFLVSLLAVAVLGAIGAFAPSLALLTVAYSANRLAGSAAWPAMVKLVPDWFGDKKMPLAMAVLSLSFVFGGVCATLFAGQIAEWSGNNWHMVMGAPSVVLLVILAVAWFVLPVRLPAQPPRPDGNNPEARSGFQFRQVFQLAGIRQFWIVCCLSFTLTLLRETFNTWTVDFFKTEGGPEISNRIAAFLSTPFDALGAVGIITLGWAFGRLGKQARSRLLVVILLVLTALIYSLPSLFHHSLWTTTIAVGAIGFLAYGPYSLLAGILSVEIKGRDYVATVSGLVDGVGYLAGILAGQQFGRLVDYGGYRLGFHALSILAFISAFLCLFLYPKQAATDPATPA
jgi:sugar phosphate permease